MFDCALNVPLESIAEFIFSKFIGSCPKVLLKIDSVLTVSLIYFHDAFVTKNISRWLLLNLDNTQNEFRTLSKYGGSGKTIASGFNGNKLFLSTRSGDKKSAKFLIISLSSA